MKLSKTQYLKGLQCPESLWLEKYKKNILTDENSSQETIFDVGQQVGELACKLFPNGKKIPYENTNINEKISLTQQYLQNQVKNIYEATFEYEGVLVMVDILHINDDGSLEIYEVKSSTDVKNVYLDDASIQYYVLHGLEYEVKKTNIIYINNKYVRDEVLEIKKLFVIADISEEVMELQEQIPVHLKNFKMILQKEHEPEIDIGPQCFDPYFCNAIDYCWQHIPEYSIFDISRLRSDKKFNLYYNNIITFQDIDDISLFSESQQIQIHSELTKKPIVNRRAIKEFLNTLNYPLYHLDFETFQQAIPEWRGISPYMQIPFQYSLHIEQQDGSLIHKEFLAQEGKDPRYELAKRLVADIPSDVTVLAYNMGFEKGVIRKLAAMFDDLETYLLSIHDNIKDLMIPFAKKDYYLPQMKGSYSIKYVLPALVPEMAEAYKELDGIHNGSEAMQTYAKLTHMEDKAEVKRMREALLKYCELDTLAMVKILEKLKL